MTQTEYIGARYVPIFADPVTWTNTRGYEPLTMVVHTGNTYISKRWVPVGADMPSGIDNEYWVLLSNFSEQLNEIITRINEAEDDISNLRGDLGTIERDLGILDTLSHTTANKVEQLEFDVDEIEDKIVDVVTGVGGFTIATAGKIGGSRVEANSYADIELIFNEPFSAIPVVIPTIFTTATTTNYANITVVVTAATTSGATLRLINGSDTGYSPAIHWIALGR